MNLPHPKTNKITQWYIDEVGIVHPLVTTLFAAYFKVRRKEINTAEAISIFEKDHC